MGIENLKVLRIHNLSQEQYDNARASNSTESGALYLTPDLSTTPLSSDSTCLLRPNRLLYYVEGSENSENINLGIAVNPMTGIEYELAPGWAATITVYNPTSLSFTSNVINETSTNDFTFEDLQQFKNFTLNIFMSGGNTSTKLDWYLYKGLPAAEELSF